MKNPEKHPFIAVRVSPELKKQIKVYCAKNKISIQAILEDYLKRLLEISK